MVVFVHPVEEEDNGNAFLGVVKMVAAKEETIGISGIVVTTIKIDIQERLVNCLNQFTKFRAHHRGSNEVDFVGSRQFLVLWVGIALFLSAANHVDVYFNDNMIQGNRPFLV